MSRTFILCQQGQVVASVTAPTLKAALREIMLYAFIYGQDGPVDIQGHISREEFSSMNKALSA